MHLFLEKRKRASVSRVNHNMKPTILSILSVYFPFGFKGRVSKMQTTLSDGIPTSYMWDKVCFGGTVNAERYLASGIRNIELFFYIGQWIQTHNPLAVRR